MRSAIIGAVLLLAPASQASAQDQSFGIGARMSMIRGDVDADTSAQRFTGGQIRARVSPRTAIEVALDIHTETNEALTERVRQLPLQASLLLFPVRAPFAPYALGGGGWYSTRVETLLDNETVASESSRKFGWHAGFGAELRLGAHAGAHADYRYTFLKFGDDETDGEGETGISRFLPSYQGSMWTAGLTFYF
jgi:opacity protein-like surface antigen